MYYTQHLYCSSGCYNCLRRDVQRRIDRGSMQMVFLTPFIFLKERTIIRIKNLVTTLKIFLTWSEDCSLCLRQSSYITTGLVGPPHPSPCCPCLCWARLLIILPFGRARPTIAPLPRADPISLRPQATTRFLNRHNNPLIVLFSCVFIYRISLYIYYSLLYFTVLFSCIYLENLCAPH